MNMKIAYLLCLVTVAVALVIGANAWKSSLTVKQITVDGNRIVGTNEILQLTQVPKGTLLYRADLMAIQRNVMGHYYIKDALIERNLPSTIHITVVERIPIAMTDRAETLYLDEDGFVLPRTISRKLFDLPIISGIPEHAVLKPGSVVTQPDLKEALLLLGVMKEVNRPLYHNISEVHMRDGGDILLYSAEGGVPIIFGRGDISGKLANLEAFWNDVVRVRGPQNLQYIDLRYQDQIVVRWNPEPPAKKPAGT
jgi:cell division protein FtsQ